jgi:nucleoside-diphosphate-sugar epimerase
MSHSALIVGASGIIGRALSEHLLGNGWTVYGMSRGRTPVAPGCHSVIADLTDAESVAHVVTKLDVTHVFFTAWSRQANEKENIRVNGAMVRNVLEPLGRTGKLSHAALVTGLKHYLGPFEAYASGATPDTPFRETQGRQPVDNFYYEQEDRLFEAADRYGFSWSVHRPHTIIGFAIGNAMNMGQTLAAYATLCRYTGQPFIFPGSAAQWNSLTDMTDARLLARHLLWASIHDEGRNEDFNVVNGDVFRWKTMWGQLAAYFGVEPVLFDGTERPLEGRMSGAAGDWAAIAAAHDLAEPNIDRIASWWHTDADLGRPMEVVTDMTKSRRAGFLDYQSTPDAFFDLFDRLKAERLIPA